MIFRWFLVNADGKAETVQGVPQEEPRIYRMAEIEGKDIYCLACQVLCTDATELIQHQTLPSHAAKLVQLGFSTNFPRIYYCHMGLCSR